MIQIALWQASCILQRMILLNEFSLNQLSHQPFEDAKIISNEIENSEIILLISILLNNCGTWC